MVQPLKNSRGTGLGPDVMSCGRKEKPAAEKIRATRRLEVVDAFRMSETGQWMILDVIPVIPPELRPMVRWTEGRFATN